MVFDASEGYLELVFSCVSVGEGKGGRCMQGKKRWRRRDGEDGDESGVGDEGVGKEIRVARGGRRVVLERCKGIGIQVSGGIFVYPNLPKCMLFGGISTLFQHNSVEVVILHPSFCAFKNRFVVLQFHHLNTKISPSAMRAHFIQRKIRT